MDAGNKLKYSPALKPKKKASDPQMKGRIYSKMGLLGKESAISEILQGSVHTMLNAEIDNFLTEERAAGTANKQNGKTDKRLIREIGDRNGGFEPERLANVNECLSWTSRYGCVK